MSFIDDIQEALTAGKAAYASAPDIRVITIVFAPNDVSFRSTGATELNAEGRSVEDCMKSIRLQLERCKEQTAYEVTAAERSLVRARDAHKNVKNLTPTPLVDLAQQAE